MLKEEIKKKPDRSDLEKLRNETLSYTEKECKSVSTASSQRDESLKHEIDRLRAEFEQHRNREFSNALQRIEALEKKLN